MQTTTALVLVAALIWMGWVGLQVSKLNDVVTEEMLHESKDEILQLIDERLGEGDDNV